MLDENTKKVITDYQNKWYKIWGKSIDAYYKSLAKYVYDSNMSEETCDKLVEWCKKTNPQFVDVVCHAYVESRMAMEDEGAITNAN